MQMYLLLRLAAERGFASGQPLVDSGDVLHPATYLTCAWPARRRLVQVGLPSSFSRGQCLIQKPGLLPSGSLIFPFPLLARFTGGPSFFIKEGSAKEQKMRELANKAGASLRKKGCSLRGGTPVVTSTLAAAAAARRQGTGLAGGSGAAAARPPSARPASGRPPTGAAAAGQKPLSEAARRLASSIHKGRHGKSDDLGLRASYRGATPGSSRRAGAGGATPATSAGGFGSTWSAAPTPSRGGSVAPSPAVHATLEEEEARVQALLRARQKELEGKAQLEAARTVAAKAMQQVTKAGPQPRVERPGAAAATTQQQQQQQQQQGGDLTAGLLNL